MKTKLGVLILLLAATLAPAQTNNLTALLQQGLFEEQANRNLDAAILDYQSLATQFDKDRQVAATAVFRLGECYRMQGKTNEAAAEYQRILTDFPDQTTLATLSRQDLTGLGISASPMNANSPDTTSQKQLSLLADEIKAAEQLLAAQQQQIQDGTLSSNAVLATQQKLNVLQIQQLLELKRVQELEAGQPISVQSAAATDEESREIQRIQQMIQNSPDLINAPDSDGITPLGNAATNGWLKVATYLLDHGADVNAGRNPPLYQAAKAGNRAMAELLLSRGADVNAKSAGGQTALHQAALHGFQAVTEVLLASHADVNIQDRAGTTPLFSAAQSGQTKIVQMILAAGAKANLKDSRGRTPLNFAIATSPEIIQALLKGGADPNTEDLEGRTPLSYAAEQDTPEVVKLLLAAKADPNGGTLDAPLLCAIHEQDAASAELLLEAGANSNAKERISWTTSIGNTFNPQGASVTPLFLAVMNKQFPMVQLLLKFKADPNDSQTDRQPVLFDALGDTNILEALLDAGGKADSRRSDGWPLLDGAVEGTNFTDMQMLLKHGADVNVRLGGQNESGGYTPLHFAALRLADPKIFELLLDNHADPNVRGSDGKTPLDLLKQESGQAASAGQFGTRTIYTSPEEQKKEALAAQLADLLRRHGALDNLPDWNSIKVSRPSANYSETVFQTGTNDWNHFTLLEFICRAVEHYNLPFPDFSRITIVRPNAGGTTSKRIEINLLNATNGVDCSKDLTLDFGDTVEIPERKHTLAESDSPLNRQLAEIVSYLEDHAGEVKLVTAGGRTAQLPLKNFEPEDCYIGNVLQSRPAQDVLTSISDLSRVKVTRRNPSTGKTNEWILDCSDHQSPGNSGSLPDNFQVRLQTIINNASQQNYNSQPSISLWLRNGDVIEVPEKP